MRNDFQMREELAKGGMPARNKKNFRPTKSGAGMTKAGVKAYRRLNPGSKLKSSHLPATEINNDLFSSNPVRQ